MVLAADTKVNKTKVWVYRNTIKALNWFTAVRTKLDDPMYSGWFYRFRQLNGSDAGNYSQPACDGNWSPRKCSPFWHDQDQSPGTLHPAAGYPKADGVCAKPCFCGDNPWYVPIARPWMSTHEHSRGGAGGRGSRATENSRLWP